MATNLRKDLLKKDKLQLVKILKSKKQPTNGNKSDLVDRILAYDEKHGDKMSKKAAKPTSPSEEEEEEEEYESEYEDDDIVYESEEEEEEEEVEPEPKPKPKKKKKKKKKNTGGGSGATPVVVDCNCSPNCDTGYGLVGVAQFFTGIAAIGQLIIGILQFTLLAEALEVCEEDAPFNMECVGKALFWEFGTDETASFNTTWRSVFTFTPSYFFANWTPMLFGIIAMMQVFASTKWWMISGTWFRCMVFHLIMILFAALPYCGKAGIIIGFVQVATGFMCFVMWITTLNGGADGDTYWTVSNN